MRTEIDFNYGVIVSKESFVMINVTKYEGIALYKMCNDLVENINAFNELPNVTDFQRGGFLKVCATRLNTLLELGHCQGLIGFDYIAYINDEGTDLLIQCME